MNSHQDSGNNQPPIATAELQHQPPSSTTENLPGFTTLRIPKTPSPTTTPPTDHQYSIVETATTTSTTPESLLADAIGRAIFNIATTNPLIRTLSDASVNQDSSITTTTTPPSKNNATIIPSKNHPIMMNTNQQPPHKTTRPNKPVRRALSDTAEYQLQSKKTRTPPPRISSSTGNPGPYCLERMRKVEDMIREIEQRCADIMHNQDDNPNSTPQQYSRVEEEEEECVGVERVENGDIKFELNCSCGKRFEMLINPNGYCFYRLT